MTSGAEAPASKIEFNRSARSAAPPKIAPIQNRLPKSVPPKSVTRKIAPSKSASPKSAPQNLVFTSVCRLWRSAFQNTIGLPVVRLAAHRRRMFWKNSRSPGVRISLEASTSCTSFRRAGDKLAGIQSPPWVPS